MAAKTDWKSGDIITSAELNNVGTLINAKAQKGDKGDAGAPGAKGDTGATTKDVAFTKDDKGNINGGTVTLSDGTNIPITIK